MQLDCLMPALNTLICLRLYHKSGLKQSREIVEVRNGANPVIPWTWLITRLAMFKDRGPTS
jgi:hypothetical protein